METNQEQENYCSNPYCLKQNCDGECEKEVSEHKKLILPGEELFLSICYYEDDEGNIIIDEEEMQKEFNSQMDGLKELYRGFK